jgi:hypothetical protein
LRDQLPRIFQAGENRTDLVARHDDGRASLATPGSVVIKRELGDSEDVFHKEGHGVECLLLGGEDIARQKTGRIHRLPELPVGEVGGTAKGIEIRLGAYRRLVAPCLDP